MKCFVGLDVSSTKLDVCIISNDNELDVLFSASLANDIVSASEIKKQVLELNEVYHFNRIVIGMEATSLYNFPPAMFFHEDSELKKLNTEVMIEQSAKIKKYREAFEENKNDTLNAFYIADYFRIERFTRAYLKEEKYLVLQHLTRTRLQLIEQLVRTKQPSNTSSQNTSLAKRGNRYLRYYLVEAANSVRNHNTEYAEFYKKKKDKIPKHKHKRVVVLTARKLVHLVDVLLRNYQLYTPPRRLMEDK